MRDTDKKSTVSHFRTPERFFCQDGRWWFSTREGEEGPFDSREHAELGMQRFVDSVKMMKKFQEDKDTEEKAEEQPEKRGDPTIWDRQIDSL